MPTARSSHPSAARRATRRLARAPLVALAGALLGGALLAGCQSDGYRYRYDPMPAEADAKGARLLVSVLGAKRGSAGQLDTMDLRLRLQSPAGVTARLLPEDLHLLTADLQEFGPAQVIGGTLQAEGGNVAVADVAFPYPDLADVNVRGLSLQWAVEVDGERVTGTSNFQKLSSGYYYTDPWYPPYYRDPWTWSVGYGASWSYVHCH